MNRHRITLQDYLGLIKFLQPEFAVTPIEEVDVLANGLKKIQRAVKHSLLVYEDVTKLDSVST